MCALTCILSAEQQNRYARITHKLNDQGIWAGVVRNKSTETKLSSPRRWAKDTDLGGQPKQYRKYNKRNYDQPVQLPRSK